MSFMMMFASLTLVAVLAATESVYANHTVLDSRFEHEYRVIENLVQLKYEERALRDTVVELTRSLEGNSIS